MDTWRCPTCLTVLADLDAKRCPSCHSRLRRRRSKPIVLGEASRLDAQAALLVDKRNRQQAERAFAQAPPLEPRAEVREPEPEPELVAIAVETPEPEVFEFEPFEFEPFELEPEPVAEPVAVADAIAAFTLPERAPVVAVPEPRPEAEPEPAPVIALETETVLDAEPEPQIDLALRSDVNTMVDELYRKARAGQAATPAATPPVVTAVEPVRVPRPARPRRRLRLTSSSSRRRRGYGRDS